MESIFTENYWSSIFNFKKKIVFNAGAEAIKEYVEAKDVAVPEIQLLFSPFGLPFVPIEIIGSNTNKIISSLVWTKDRNNPGGVLSVEFAPDPETVKEIVDIINQIAGNIYSIIWGEMGVEVEDLFKPMTLMQLWINGCHVMTGNVRSCHRNSSVSNNSKNVSYSMVCEELGGLYDLPTMSLDLILQDNYVKTIDDATKKALSMVARTQGVSIQQGIEAIFFAFKTMVLDQGVSTSDGFPLAARLLTTGNPIGGIATMSIAQYMTADSNIFQLSTAGGGQQTIWSFIKNFIPSPWMELFTESGGRTIVTDLIGAPSVLFPGFNYVVARTTPYSNPLLGFVHPLWLKNSLTYDLGVLPLLIGGDFIIITDAMIQHKTLGVDGSNQKTVFHSIYSGKSVTEQSLATRSIKSIGPFNPMASGGIPTFGIREMWQHIDFCSTTGLGAAPANAQKIAKAFGLPGTVISHYELSNLLAVWFRNQSRFREGQVTVKGIPYARAGMYCLYLPEISGRKVENLRDIGLYYIDSLNHNYTLNNDGIDFSTTLNLIRGVPMPINLMQSALLMFDFEVLPPASGQVDGEYNFARGVRLARQGIKIP